MIEIAPIKFTPEALAALRNFQKALVEGYLLFARQTREIMSRFGLEFEAAPRRPSRGYRRYVRNTKAASRR